VATITVDGKLARGRNGKFVPKAITVTAEADVVINVYSKKIGKNPPISLWLCAEDAVALASTVIEETGCGVHANWSPVYVRRKR
jgi:hypothetical protein